MENNSHSRGGPAPAETKDAGESPASGDEARPETEDDHREPGADDGTGRVKLNRPAPGRVNGAVPAGTNDPVHRPGRREAAMREPVAAGWS